MAQQNRSLLCVVFLFGSHAGDQGKANREGVYNASP